jgi:hypothetical protein
MMSASPNIFWKTSHHFAVKRQYIIFVKKMHHIAVGDASFDKQPILWYNSGRKAVKQ